MAVFPREPARLLSLLCCLLCFPAVSRATDARFDLVGPRIDIRVTRGPEGSRQTLPIAAVPNLQPGDKLWLHPDLPPSQSVHYLLICAFLRGTTNPPPDAWFTRIPTWDKHVREEGAFLTVPAEAEQAVLFLAPETGGDFGTLKSAVKGRPGIFVRASQDLAEAGFEQARIEKYLASIRQVPPSDSADLQKHSALLARTLALKPNDACFKQPIDTQFTCLTQTGSQALLDDGHGQSIVAALSSGPNSDFLGAASNTKLLGGGEYSAYVGAIIDLVRIMGSVHTAQFQYIPAIAFPQGEALNLRLNTPPSFHNPKSVLVIGLPAVQKAIPPPLRPADPGSVACLLKPSVVLPIEGAPLVFSTGFAHDLILHLNTPPGSPSRPDIPLSPDAYQGGLVLQAVTQHTPLRDAAPPAKLLNSADAKAFAHPDLHAGSDRPQPEFQSAPEPVLLTGTIQGRWGFDTFTGPEIQLQQLPGTGWHIVAGSDPSEPTSELIAGHSAQLRIASTGTACVHTITARPPETLQPLPISFRPEAASAGPSILTLSLPLEHAAQPGDLHLAIQQYGQPAADELSTRTFNEPAHISTLELHAGDRNLRLTGTDLAQVASVRIGDLVFTPASNASADGASPPAGSTVLQLALPGGSPAPPTVVDQSLSAIIALRDGRTLTRPVHVDAPRPVITLLRKSSTASDLAPSATLSLGSPDDLPLSRRLTFTLKSAEPFPRSGQIEISTLDGTLRAVLTLAPTGGLVLQDPHTLVATLDPLRAFGPSAFGPLQLRAVFPDAPAPGIRHEHTPPQQISVDTGGNETVAQGPEPTPNPGFSDWVPLGTLVRLPTFKTLTCPAEPDQPCTLTGANLFLLQSISADAQFTNPTPVPDGFTGDTLQVPRTTAGIFFFKLRDNPVSTNSTTFPDPPAPPMVPTSPHKNKH